MAPWGEGAYGDGRESPRSEWADSHFMLVIVTMRSVAEDPCCSSVSRNGARALAEEGSRQVATICVRDAFQAALQRLASILSKLPVVMQR